MTTEEFKEFARDNLVNLKEASKIVGYSYRTLFGYYQHDGLFPRPVIVNSNMALFLKEELIDWVKEHMRIVQDLSSRRQKK